MAWLYRPGAAVELRLRQFGEGLPAGRGVDRLGHIEQPRKYPVDIAVHDGTGGVEGGRADGRSGVVAHTAQRAHRFIVGGEAAAETGDDLTGGGMEVARPGVVAEPLPEFEHSSSEAAARARTSGKRSVKRR